MASFGIDLGWVGFGIDGGLLPGVRVGVFAVWICRGTIRGRIAALHVALAEAARELGRGR
jgi:hypothetical protein